jgi:hypothetical protein
MFSTIITWKDGKNVVQLIDVTEKIVAEMTLEVWLKLPAVRYAVELARGERSARPRCRLVQRHGFWKRENALALSHNGDTQ